jgi:hypothetical protein
LTTSFARGLAQVPRRPLRCRFVPRDFTMRLRLFGTGGIVFFERMKEAGADAVVSPSPGMPLGVLGAARKVNELRNGAKP